MSESNERSGIEAVAGSVAVAAGLTYFSAAHGAPITALLPVLVGSLAAGRQQKRVAAALTAIQESLSAQPDRVRELSDEQYKVVNEAVLAVLQTTQDEKLAELAP